MIHKLTIDLVGSNKRRRHIIYSHVEHLAIYAGCIAHVGDRYATLYGLSQEDVSYCHDIIMNEMKTLDGMIGEKRKYSQEISLMYPIDSEAKQEAAKTASSLILQNVWLSVINTNEVVMHVDKPKRKSKTPAWATYFNLTVNSSLEDVKKAYRNTMKQCHPDNAGSDKMAAECNSMYSEAKMFFNSNID